MVEITNITYCADLNCELNLLHIANNSFDVEYSPRKMNALIMRIRNPKSTCLVFKNGKLVLTGCRSVFQASKSVRKFARKIQRFGYEVKLTNRRVANMVGSVKFEGYEINLEKLSEIMGCSASFEPELFPGLIYASHMCKMTLFRSAIINITGCKSKEDLNNAFDDICQYIFVDGVLKEKVMTNK